MSAANELDVTVSWTQEEKFHICKQPFIIFFRNINKIALYWPENSTLLMNENEKIDNLLIKVVKCVGAKAEDEKLRWNTTRTNNERNF